MFISFYAYRISIEYLLIMHSFSEIGKFLVNKPRAQHRSIIISSGFDYNLILQIYFNMILR